MASRHKPDPDGMLRLTTRQQLLQTIANLQLAGGQAAEAIPLYRAALDGLRVVRVVDRRQRFPTELLSGEHPTLAIIGDDDFRPTGPAGWSCTRTASKWPAAFIIYAGAANAQLYQHAVDTAQAVRRALLIETTAEYVSSWYKLVPHGMPALVVSPEFAASVRDGAAPATPRTVH